MATNVAYAPIAAPRYRLTIIFGLTALAAVMAAFWYRDPLICFGAGSWATSAILSAAHIRDTRKAVAQNQALRAELGLNRKDTKV